MSLEQLHSADLELCKRMMEATRSGIRPFVGGGRPLETALQEHSRSTHVLLYLQPLPGSSAGAGGSGNRPGGPGGGGGSGGGGVGSGKRKRGERNDSSDPEVSRLRRQVASLEGRLKQAQATGNQSRPGGKGRNRVDRMKLPQELLGMEAVGADGLSRCFAFNMDGCKQAKPGGRCSRGTHQCMRPGCGKAHSQRDH